MIRLDKYLADLGIGSRKEVKKYIKDGYVEVNANIIKKDDFKVNENIDIVRFNNEELTYKKNVYLMINKPRSCLCANDSKLYPSIFEYLPEYSHRNLFTVGRLDVDTTGLLIITDDGDFAHKIISPKSNIDKVYECQIRDEITCEMIVKLENGMEFKDFKADKAKVEVIAPKLIHLIIHEGKFHQVKRMLIGVGNEVEALKRIKIGELDLDSKLAEGQYRELSEIEINKLVKAQ